MIKIIRSSLGIKPVEMDTTYCFYNDRNHRYYIRIIPYINGNYHYYITKDYENGKCIIEEDNVELKEIKKVVNKIIKLELI